VLLFARSWKATFSNGWGVKDEQPCMISKRNANEKIQDLQDITIIFSAF